MFRFALASALAAAEAGTLAITYQDCGATHARVNDLQPTTIHTGRTEVITGSGTSDEDVTSAQFTATVSALGAKIADCSGDGTTDIECRLPLGVGKITVKALSFPIMKGNVSIPVEVQTSWLIPASLANVDVHIEATEQNGESAICLDVHTAKALSEERGNCCWGGSSCATATGCHVDAYCGASEDQCTGDCAGVWCPDPEPNRTTTPAPYSTTPPPAPAPDTTTAAPAPAPNMTTLAPSPAPSPDTTTAPATAPNMSAPAPDPAPAPAPTPSPAPAPGPAPVPTGVCCWGGSTCDVAQNCHFDAYCGASEEQCTGDCAGMWCAEAPPTPVPPNGTTASTTPVPSNSTTTGAQPCDCEWAAAGCDSMEDDGSICYKQCCGEVPSTPMPPNGTTASTTPVPPNSTTTGAQPCDCDWAEGGCESMEDDGSLCYKQCCSDPSEVLV